MQDSFRLRKCYYKKLFLNFGEAMLIVIAMIKGEIIAMENRLHGYVFVIVIAGIDIIKP